MAAVNTAFDLLLVAIIVAAAAAACLGRGSFRAVVFQIVCGLSIALAWLRLDAIDVALAEAAIGSGLTGILLLAALNSLRRHQTDTPPQPAGRGVTVIAACACLALSIAIATVVLLLPGNAAPNPDLAHRVEAALPLTGVDNPVTAVLLNLRGWDTLLESIVLLAALLGVWSLSRRSDDQQQQAGPRHLTRPGGILMQIGTLLPPLALIVGIHLIWIGSSEPGGAFQGGTVLAAAWILTVLAGLTAPPRVDDPRVRAALLIGPVAFLLFAMLGITAGGWLIYPLAQAYWVTLCIEVLLGVSIATTLAMLVFGPPRQGAP